MGRHDKLSPAQSPQKPLPQRNERNHFSSPALLSFIIPGDDRKVFAPQLFPCLEEGLDLPLPDVFFCRDGADLQQLPDGFALLDDKINLTLLVILPVVNLQLALLGLPSLELHRNLIFNDLPPIFLEPESHCLDQSTAH